MTTLSELPRVSSRRGDKDRIEQPGDYVVAMDVGDTVENFTLDDQHGNPVSFDSLVESGPVVVYFYIKAMTSG